MKKSISLCSMTLLAILMLVSCGTTNTASTPIEVKDEGFDPAAMNAKLVEPKESMTQSGMSMEKNTASGIKMTTKALDR